LLVFDPDEALIVVRPQSTESGRELELALSKIPHERADS